MDPSSISCMNGGQCPHHSGGHPMVPNITATLRRFTGEWALLRQPDASLAVCREIGYTAWRDRLLTPVTTVQLFRRHILPGHIACRHLPHLSGLRCSAAAYGQARATLPRHCFHLPLERCASVVQPCGSSAGWWHGHRLLFVDGSGGSMPKSPGRTGHIRPADRAAANILV